MQFNDTTTYQGIIQSCEHYTNKGRNGIASNSELLDEFTRHSNKIMREVWHEIFLSTGNWLYDDSNQTDLPQATTDLVSGQATYALPSEALTIERVEITDENGNDRLLEQTNLSSIPFAVDEWRDANGQPFQYRVVGRTIELFPAPNYNATAGLKVYFQRSAVEFTASDTTEQPGFASPYHDIVAVGASIEWLKVKETTSGTLNTLKQDYQIQLQKIIDFYKMRNRDGKTKITRRKAVYN